MWNEYILISAVPSLSLAIAFPCSVSGLRRYTILEQPWHVSLRKQTSVDQTLEWDTESTMYSNWNIYVEDTYRRSCEWRLRARQMSIIGVLFLIYPENLQEFFFLVKLTEHFEMKVKFQVKIPGNSLNLRNK